MDVVYAGKIEARKGVAPLVAAARHMPGRRIAIAGGPPEAADALRAEVVGPGLQDGVDVSGRLLPAEVPGFLSRGRVGDCPLAADLETVSDRYNSPLKLLQMMGLGMTIVVSGV